MAENQRKYSNTVGPITALKRDGTAASKTILHPYEAAFCCLFFYSHTQPVISLNLSQIIGKIL